MNDTTVFIVCLSAAVLALGVSSFLVGYVNGFSRCAKHAVRAQERRERKEEYQGKRILPDGHEGIQEAGRAFYQERGEDSDA